MKILYITQYLVLPKEAGGGRHYAFATELQKKGHRVTVITGMQNYTTGLVEEKYMGKWFVREEIEGVDVIRTSSYTNFKSKDGRINVSKRLLNHFSFMTMAIIAGLREKNVDLVFASSTPLFVGVSGWILSVLKNAPFVFEVRDLWPESAVAIGVLNNKSIIKASEALERFLYKKAKKLIAVTQGIRDGIIARGINPQKVELITNGVDLNIYDRLEEQNISRSNLGWENKFVCIYVGSHGIVNNLAVILKAAKELEGYEDIIFVLIGNGDNKPHLEKMKQDLQLNNVFLLPPVSKNLVPAYLNAADVCLLSFREEEIFKGMFPNKIFDYFASSTPTIAAARGEVSELIELAQAGLTVAPGDFKAMAEAVLRLQKMPPSERKEMGRRGRAYILKHYQRVDLADKLAQTFMAVQTRCYE